MASFTQPLTVNVLQGSGAFTVNNGNILAPDGSNFVARGINIDNGQATAAHILNYFPGLNFLRCSVGQTPWSGNPQSLPLATDFDSFVTDVTNSKIVIEIEMHPFPLHNAMTGADLTTETDWYASLADHFKSNPYVWFGTQNEPQGGDLTAEHVATYNAIRGTGNNNPIMMVGGIGGGDPTLTGPAVLNSANYANMKNVIWDLHFYGWVNNKQSILDGPNGLRDILAGFADISQSGQGRTQDNTGVHAVQEITSADGIIPVITGETGNSTSGDGIDANADDVIDTSTNWAPANKITRGFAAWHWFAGGNGGDDLVDNSGNGVLTTYGQQIANAIQFAKNNF